MEKINLLMLEYESLRDEVLTTLEARNSILSFGLPTIGLVFTAGIAFTEIGPLVAGLVFLVFIPIFSIFIMFMWLGEYQRMQRAGKFIAQLEKRINSLYEEEILTWESSLRTKRSQMKYPYNSTVLLLTLSSLLSTGIGLFIVDFTNWATIILVVLLLVIHFFIYRYAINSMGKSRIDN